MCHPSPPAVVFHPLISQWESCPLRKASRTGMGDCCDSTLTLHFLPPEPLNGVTVLSSGPLDAIAPVWPSPREDPATTPPAHSVPVPATELGSTELVTTKTAGPEQ